MDASPHSSPSLDEARLLQTLQRLLGIASPKLHPVLDQASDPVGEPLGADKVDVLLYEAETDSLVALGTSRTPTGRKQHERGWTASRWAAPGRPRGSTPSASRT